jgi:hypothetical protein
VATASSCRGILVLATGLGGPGIRGLPVGDDPASPAVVGRQHAAVDYQVDARARHQGGELGEKLDRFEEEVRRPVVASAT